MGFRITKTQPILQRRFQSQPRESSFLRLLLRTTCRVSPLLILIAGFLFTVVVQYGKIPEVNSPALQQAQDTIRTGTSSTNTYPSIPRLTILDLPELTTWIIGNYTEEATQFYNTTLNEEQGEIWLHRGFLRLIESDQTMPQRDMNSLSMHTSHTKQNENYHIVVIICAYLHLNHHLYKKLYKKGKSRRMRQSPYSVDELMNLLTARVRDNLNYNYNIGAEKVTYILAVPTWNPTRGNDIGLSHIQQLFHTLLGNEDKLNAGSSSSNGSSGNKALQFLSLGYERNIYWQKVLHPSQIIPIPYVVTPLTNQPNTQSDKETEESNMSKQNKTYSIFYAGDTRPNAVRWSGCNRTALLHPIIQAYDSMNINPDENRKSNKSHNNHNYNHSKIFIRLIDSKRRSKHKTDKNQSKQVFQQQQQQRLSTIEYNTIMSHSKFCLILCGDTPTSRSLASSIVNGCIPLFIGIERWYGYCLYPCHIGWGWNTLNKGLINNNRNNYQSKKQTKHTSLILSHFPYETMFDYTQFPSINENDFLQNPIQSLQTFLHHQSLDDTTDSLNRYHSNKKLQLQQQQQEYDANNSDNDNDFLLLQSAYIYGYGHPMDTLLFGNAIEYIWTSIVQYTC